jgi:hypothetical protein
VIPPTGALTRLRECTKMGQRPPPVDFACPVDSCWEVFDVDRALVVRVVWPRRGHGSFGVGGGWR